MKFSRIILLASVLLCSAYARLHAQYLGGIGDGYASVTSDFVIPVELVSFTVLELNGKVTLIWTTASELNNIGFEVQRKFSNQPFNDDGKQGEWEKIGFIEGNGTTTETQNYVFIDDISDIATKLISYRLKQLDFDGSFRYSLVLNVEDQIPTQYALHQNFPNPFNPSTSILYTISQSSNVVIKVFDILGNEMETLVSEEKPIGSFKVTWNAEQLPSGVYFYRLQAVPNGRQARDPSASSGQSFVETKKMVLLR